jgi:hypothetical protein
MPPSGAIRGAERAYTLDHARATSVAGERAGLDAVGSSTSPGAVTDAVLPPAGQLDDDKRGANE